MVHCKPAKRDLNNARLSEYHDGAVTSPSIQSEMHVLTQIENNKNDCSD